MISPSAIASALRRGALRGVCLTLLLAGPSLIYSFPREAQAQPQAVCAATRVENTYADLTNGRGSDLLVQAGDDESVEVSPGDIEKYVAVYRAMQLDHKLTVEQAASQQGLTLQSFRDLENRVERDDAAMQRARDELQAAAIHAPPAGHSPSPGNAR